MYDRSTRRRFLKTAVASAVIPASVPSIAQALSATDKIRHAAIGVRGMGGHDLKHIASHPNVEIVALCDIDDQRLDQAAEQFPQARRYHDFRELFDKEAKRMDSCNVSVPDHMHAPIAMTAMRAGKHVFCQKPLTHEIDEAQELRLAAKQFGVVTQLGTQGHSHVAYRTAVATIQDGVIGRVKAVHTWADRRWSNNGRPRPEPPPSHVNWDLWLGVAPQRPWGEGAYHPGKWWSWIDFGTGNLGDMGCHLFDPVVGSLRLGPPSSVRAECQAPQAESWPNFGQVFYEFPGTPYTADPVTVTWYDGGYKKGHHPPPYLVPLPEQEGTSAESGAARSGRRTALPPAGSLFIGERGNLLLPHVGNLELYPVNEFQTYRIPQIDGLNHWHRFVNGCLGRVQPTANFDFAGPLTETVLLGNLARRFPHQVLEWDAEKLKVTNFDAANEFVGRKYRKGWEIEGLS